MKNEMLNNQDNADIKIFFGNWTCAQDVFEAFYLSKADQIGIQFIYADYDTPEYEGNAFVIFIKDKILYEVNGSHCSCNGLEECWGPEETTLNALMFRPNVPQMAKNNLKKVYPNLIAFL